MNRQQAKELLPIITHFANGGDLWYYSEVDKKWYKQNYIIETKISIKISNIIEDKHFEARKAFALGNAIKARHEHCNWLTSKTPDWKTFDEYRPQELVYEWRYTSYNRETLEWELSKHYFSSENIEGEWLKFEPSKRIKNERLK